MSRLYGVQYLRALAALGVVVFHAAERSGGHFAIGAAGVDVFFVISGFIMWVLAETRQTLPAAFLRDRIERIVPLYWIATAVMVFGGLAGLFPKMQLTPFHVFGSFAFIPHYSPSDGGLWPVLVQGWTLNYEMFFYALFAGVLFLPRERRFAALAMLFVTLVAVGLLTRPENAALKTYTSPQLLEFLLGIGIGRLWLAQRLPSAPGGVALLLLALIGFGLVAAGLLAFDSWILAPLAGALLLGVLALERAGPMRRVGVFAYLGDASYSIYLWHTLAISVVVKAAGLAGLAPGLTFAAAVGAGVFAGVVSYTLLEKPLLRLMKARRAASLRAGYAT